MAPPVLTWNVDRATMGGNTMHRTPRHMSRSTGLAMIWASYLWTIVVALSIGWLLPIESPLIKAGVVDLIATIMIFAISLIFDNSSFYDPYWSVAPIVMTGYWVVQGWGGNGSGWRSGFVLFLVMVWGIRLTANFLRHWRGMGHEDWRYAAYREKGRSIYWVVSFFGFHMAPTLIVFGACVPVYFASTDGGAMGVIDVLAIGITLTAILIEAAADSQMRAFAATGRDCGTTFRSGLWATSRHPNYFGEILFWWGLYLLALGADAGYWWTIFGPVGVTILFLVVSLPLIEARMRQRRGDYDRVCAEVSRLVPWFPKGR